eukprot:2620854-Pyramimonas_sp.AAC.1
MSVSPSYGILCGIVKALEVLERVYLNDVVNAVKTRVCFSVCQNSTQSSSDIRRGRGAAAVGHDRAGRHAKLTSHVPSAE